MYVDSWMKVYSNLINQRASCKIVLNEYGLLFTNVDTIKGIKGSMLGIYTKHREVWPIRKRPFCKSKRLGHLSASHEM